MSAKAKSVKSASQPATKTTTKVAAKKAPSIDAEKQVPKIQTLADALGVKDGEALLKRAADMEAIDAAFAKIKKSLQENGQHTLEDILRLPATPMNLKKIEHLIDLPDAYAKIIVSTGEMIKNDLFPKCVIAKAELHAKELKKNEQERKQQERLKKRKGIGSSGATANKTPAAKKAKKAKEEEEEVDEDQVQEDEEDDGGAEEGQAEEEKNCAKEETAAVVVVSATSAIQILQQASDATDATLDQTRALVTKSETLPASVEAASVEQPPAVENIITAETKEEEAKTTPAEAENSTATQ